MTLNKIYYRKACCVCGCDLGPGKRLPTQQEGEVLCFDCPYPEDDQRSIAKVLAKLDRAEPKAERRVFPSLLIDQIEGSAPESLAECMAPLFADEWGDV